jgi:ADP-heptose:LPS heptosyltransferase/GT2 family glycosyltransferase
VPVFSGEYELLAKSGLFDAAYYLKSNPDVAALNVDPLLHYVEQGCRERRDPSENFNTAHYLKLCGRLGEEPVNALAHYLTVGISKGLTPKLGTTPSIGMLSVDFPRIVDGVADVPVRGGLSIVGWGLAPGRASSVDILLDGHRITTARCVIRRPDVAVAHPQWEESLLSGYAVHLPPKSLTMGRHQVTVSMDDREGQGARVDFQIVVEDFPDTRGPWALRRRIRQAEVDHQSDTLRRMRWRPHFRVFLALASNRKTIDAARRTLETLARQNYPDWDLCVLPIGVKAKAGGRLAALKANLIDGFDGIEHQITVANPKSDDVSGSQRKRSGDAGKSVYVARVAPGDELGCDALLEFALASGFDRRAEFIYSDERRLDPADGKLGAFFKPGWSPDLHLSTNYLGRAWCAVSGLLERAGVGAREIGTLGDYDMSLRLTEAARSISHVSKVLFQRAAISRENHVQERRALKDALKRRHIAAEIQPGGLAGLYRIKRKVPAGRVSIVIPTCAADGLIKTCLETLRARTANQHYEIVCIENIPQAQSDWKTWLRAHADVVLETHEPFNWSRYNNQAATRATGKFLLFLNDDIEIIESDWLDALLEQAQRPEVGVVGPLLLYPNRSVQQAGVMLDDAGRGRHAFRHLPEGDAGYFGLALTQRNVISVTGACLLTRRETFDSLGGFDEAHAIINNDLDFCLRARQKKLLNVYTPHARLIHHELASRGRLPENYDVSKFNERWRQIITTGDPYFNPHLSRDQEIFSIEREPFEIVYAGHPAFSRSAVRRILVIKLDHIGDCITAIAALRRLKRHFPAARISVLAARGTLEIWKSEPGVAEVIEFNFFHARSGAGKVEVTGQDMKTITERLQAQRFDLAIDLRKQPDTRHLLELSGADVLVGFDTQGRFPWLDVALEWDEDAPLRTKHGHVSDDLVALVEAVAAHSDTDRRAVLDPPKGALSLPTGERRRLFSRPLICIHPAAGSPMRQWPPENFARLIDRFLDTERFNVALIGGADEKALALHVMAGVTRTGLATNLVGRLSLSELPSLLAASVLFVGNNSGPQHWAAGLGVPTVGIHSGVVDAREWGPMGPRAVAVRRDMWCSPCFIEQPKNCPRSLACLNDLTVADVYGICSNMLSGAGSTSKPGIGSTKAVPFSS